jgi:predicted O-methyltransferase YrrM
VLTKETLSHNAPFLRAQARPRSAARCEAGSASPKNVRSRSVEVTVQPAVGADKSHTVSMTADSGALGGIRAERHRLSSEGPAFVRADGDYERVSIPEADASVLRDVLVSEHAATVIEIGLAYGASALAIAEALVSTNPADARHVIIDAYQDQFGDAGWTALVDAGLTEICSLLREPSQLALPQLVRDGIVADAAFVDGSHIFHNVFVDLHFLRQLVRPGGLVVLDDCEWPSVATAVRHFELNTGWLRQELPTSTRLQAYRLPDEIAEPNFADFKPFG